MPVRSEGKGSVASEYVFTYNHPPKIAFGKGNSNHIHKDTSRLGSSMFIREDKRHLGPTTYAAGYRLASPHINVRSQDTAILLHTPAGRTDRQIFGSSVGSLHDVRAAKSSAHAVDEVGLSHTKIPKAAPAYRPFDSGVSRFHQKSEQIPPRCSNRPTSLDRTGQPGGDAPAVGSYFRSGPSRTIKARLKQGTRTNAPATRANTHPRGHPKKNLTRHSGGQPAWTGNRAARFPKSPAIDACGRR